MIQNATNAAQLSPEQVIELCETIEHVSYVKQEVIPGPVTISKLMALNSPALKLVMSGYAGLFSPMDHARGASATIHACEYCDLVQKVWNLLDAGREQEALDLQGIILPALQMESLLGMTYAKEVMIRRGIFKNSRTRTKTGGLTDADKEDLDRIWPRIEPHFV
jgi:dihydrodipicolinate synthase/N-acetylneuraminate lyase